VRCRKAELKRRVNGDLQLRFEAEGLTSFAGLELLRQYFSKLELAGQIRRHVARYLPSSDYGGVAMVLLVLTLIISGGRRVRHSGYLGSDPMVLRCCGLKRIPSARTVGRWLSGFSSAALEGLGRLNEALTMAVIRAARLARLTLDVDGSVISTGLKVEGAKRGFNPHHRKVPSYYPITAYEAQTGQVLAVENRPGNVHDGKAGVRFIEQLIERLRSELGRGPVLEMRMDGAFFREDVLEVLERTPGLEYAIKVPFYQWLGLKELIAQRCRWQEVAPGVSGFERRLKIEPWERRCRVVVYRKRVHHRTAKNYQLDLFDPDDGYYEYSAVVTNKTVSARTLWYFMAGRGTHEKVYAELKSGFAFGCVPSLSYAANSAWQWFSILAFNLTRGFQHATTAPRRSMNRKRRSLWRFDSIHTLRFQCLHRAGLLLRPAGYPTLDVGTTSSVRRRFEAIHRRLRAA
jgi:hypothetical protein